MPISLRSRNLDLIRGIFHGHQSVLKQLAGFTNSTYLSQMAWGKRPIDDAQARTIESKMGLPKGWMDRDNIRALHTSDSDYTLCEKVVRLPDAKKQALLALLSESPE